MKNLLFSIVFIFSTTACAATQANLDRASHDQIVADLKKATNTPGLIRIITDENHEVPDPTRPLLVRLPSGDSKYVIGLSGQNILMVDSLNDLIFGGIRRTQKVDLTNQYGFNYGGEINPSTGQPLGYDRDSSTWDVAVFHYRDEAGQESLRVLAGAMGTGEDGKPLLVQDGHNNTRQRLFFDAEFRGTKLHASNPRAVLNSGKPLNGNWIQHDDKGRIIFSHGYGGEPVTLANGDLYVDERGWVPFVYETVVEQREKIPYRTAIVVAYLDRTLSRVMQPAKIIFDVFKPDGSIWEAAQRPTAGPLVEGAHIEVRHNGRPVESLKELKSLRSQQAQLEYQMLFSAGEYFGHYGSYMAHSKNNLENFVPVLNEQSELLDLTAPLRVLFTWIGRPVSFHVKGQEYLMIHGVDRNSLPRGFVLDQLPEPNEWPHFRRQEIVVPVKRKLKNGVEVLEIQDASGLLERLKNYVPRRVSFLKVDVLGIELNQAHPLLC